MCFGGKSKAGGLSHLEESNVNSRPTEPRISSITSKMPHNDYNSPSGPPPSYNQNNEFSPPSGPPPNRNETYAPPSGPPPNQQQYIPPHGPPPSREQYIPPQGPPPSHDQYTAPAGPPPSHGEYTPPPGPPPSQAPQHNWQTAVPDTSLLPPPPSFFSGNQRSSTNNATEAEAMQGEHWCENNRLTEPVNLPEAALEALEAGNIGVIQPRTFKGVLERTRQGVWAGKSESSSPDSCITSVIPLYSVMAHSPMRTGQQKTVYYEVRIAAGNREEVSLAMGYGAAPYPSFRLPGWHRGCFAVHGDDGSKYINDLWGGKDFTRPFKPGQTLGIGMKFSSRDMGAPPSYGPAQTTVATPIDVEIFFTRNGRLDGSWNLHEEGDAKEDRPVTGMEGFNDLYAVIGTFDKVKFEILFNPADWMFRP